MARHAVLVSVVEPQTPENSESVLRLPVELRVQAAELATVIEPIDLVDMPRGARGRCHAAIEQRHIREIPTLLRSSAREPIEARGQIERTRQRAGDEGVEIELGHPASLVEAIA